MTIPPNLDQAEALDLLQKLTGQAEEIHSRCQASGKFLGSIPTASGDTLADTCQLAAFVDQGRQLLGEAPVSEQLAKQSARTVTPKPARPLTATEKTLLAISEADAGESSYVSELLADPNLNWTERCKLARQFRDRKRAAATPSPTTVPEGRAANWTERILASKGIPIDTPAFNKY